MARRNEKRGFGSIRKLPSGRFEARYTGPTGERVKAPTTFERKITAEGWLADERVRTERPETWVPPKERLLAARAAARADAKPTFVEYAEQWISRRRVNGKPLAIRTQASDHDYLRRFLNPTFGSMPIDQITFTMVDEWYSTLLPDHPNQRAKVYGFARAVMNTAVSQGGPLPGRGNPFAIRGAGSAEVQPRHEYLFTDEERNALVEHIRDDHRAMILLALWCGLRYGEIVALRRADIDLERRMVKVTRSIAFPPSAAPVAKEPKSAAGRRAARIPASVLPEIEHHLRTYVPPGDDALLFASASGGYLRPSAFYGKRGARGWYGALEAAGRWSDDANLRPNFHDLRATGATEVARLTPNQAEVQRWLGDSTPQAAQRYIRAGDGAMDELADLLSAVAERSTSKAGTADSQGATHG